ncbi:MAG: hypothetical protein ABJB12_03360 [Pseudomonadota bacterium]
MKFTIELGEFGGAAAAPSSYESLEQAREALRCELGWAQVFLGPGYTTDDGTNQIWHAYPAPPPDEGNLEDQRAPRITRSSDGTPEADAEWRGA